VFLLTPIKRLTLFRRAEGAAPPKGGINFCGLKVSSQDQLAAPP